MSIGLRAREDAVKKSDLIHKLEILEQGLRKLRLRATRESAPPADTLLQAFDETQALLEELRFAEEDQPPRRKKPAAGESATTEYGCTGEELAGQAVILKSMGDGIVVTGIEGKIQYVNPAFERMSGYALPELRGLNGRDLIDGLDEGLFHKTRKALPNGEAVGNSFQIQKKDG